MDEDASSYLSMTIDLTDKLHVSYLGRTTLDIKYATNATNTWETEIIEGSGYGGYTSIAVDSKNRVHISYYDINNGDLKYATAILPGRIYGSIANKQGNPIQGVRVELKGEKTKIKKKTSSDSSGSFSFEGLEKDTYTITAKKKGYRTSKQKTELEEGEEGEVKIVMKKMKNKKSIENQIFYYDKPASILSRSIERCLSLFHFSRNCSEEIILLK